MRTPVGELFSKAKNAPKKAVRCRKKIKTPYGDAVQSNTSAAKATLKDVRNGATVYRGGKLGESNIGEGQFWAAEHPLNPGYADKYGVASFQEPDFIVGGKLQNSNFITRPAPPVPPNSGGGTEIVTPPNNVRLDFFHMP